MTKHPVLEALDKKHLKQAYQLARQALQVAPEEHNNHYLMSVVLLEGRDVNNALIFARQALQLDPANLFYAAYVGKVLLFAGRQREALDMARQTETHNPGSAQTWDILNIIYTQCGELSRAVVAAEHAAKLTPDSNHYRFNYAAALRNVGNFADAERVYDEVIHHNPQEWEAIKNRSDLRRQTLDNNHIEPLKAILEKHPPPRGEILICSALAKELEDIEHYPQSFHYLERGNALRRRMMKYSVAEDVAVMDALAEHFSADDFSPVAEGGCSSREPIFILGMPRTGSTLLERMLGMHSEVFAAGELQNFTLQLMAAANAGEKKPLGKLALVGKAGALDVEKLGNAYIESTRPRTGHCARFIDKMPNNFLNLALIRRALPNAKVIHLRRHPMDTCYAIYKNLFKDAYPFSYDQHDLAAYYIAYRRLMDHWHRVMPGYIMDVDYEVLVNEPEATLRQVLAFCNLEWQPACLAFDKNSAPTNTASASQVRQKLYSGSIGKWRHFAEELQPLHSELSRAGLIDNTAD